MTAETPDNQTAPRASAPSWLWVPAVPLPRFGIRKTCDCGRAFWTMDGYRGHYAYVHILGM